MNAITPPTPERVADLLAGGDNDYHDGNDWWPAISTTGNVVDIAITPVGEDYETKLPKVHFRAVVAPVSEDGMSDGPFDVIGTPGGRVLLGFSDISSLLNLSPEQAYTAAAQLIAAASLATLGEAETR